MFSLSSAMVVKAMFGKHYPFDRYACPFDQYPFDHATALFIAVMNNFFYEVIDEIGTIPLT
jgi:hypothetical protein